MNEKLKLPSYGGQALIEGILMRSRKYVSSAFRLPDGTIKTQTEELTGIYKSKIFTIPFLRGLVALWDSLVLGTKYLTISANFQVKEDEKSKVVPSFSAFSSHWRWNMYFHSRSCHAGIMAGKDATLVSIADQYH